MEVTLKAFGLKQLLGKLGLKSCIINSPYITFTFVGTGLDMKGVPVGADVAIDGALIGKTTKKEMLVSGLPFGTHTVKLGLT